MYLRYQQVPRNGNIMRAIIVARISGCADQRSISLADQVDNCKQTSQDVYDGPIEYEEIHAIAKGERNDRPELQVLEDKLRTRNYDLLLFEDIGRLIRGAEASRLIGIAVDHGTRVLSPNDGFDTRDPSWGSDVLTACAEHVGHNEHTSKRIKAKMKLRFHRNGESLMGLPYGYFLPEGEGKSYHNVQILPEAPVWISQGAEMLRLTLNCSAVGRFFNTNGVPRGVRTRRVAWNGSAIRKFFSNPILKGTPQRGAMTSEKHNESGRRRSVKNPEGSVFINCPNLKILEPEEFDALNALLTDKNQRYRRKERAGQDPRYRVPRKVTRYPGQQGTCWYCGSHFVWGGNGQTDFLMCARSREWKCWNSVAFNGPLFVERLAEAVLDRLTCLDGFDNQIRELVEQASQANSVNIQLEKFRRDEGELQREKANLTEAIKKFGPQDMFAEQIASLSQQEAILGGEIRRLNLASNRTLELPQSSSDLRSLVERSFTDLAPTSPEFGALLRQIVPEFHVYLVRLCDGGHPYPRARVQLDLSGIVPDARLVNGLQELLSTTVTLDLFTPPQRELIRLDAVRLVGEGQKQRDACRLIEGCPTQPALQNALALQKEMDRRGLSSPYIFLTEPPSDYKKLRRHQAAHFQFEPLTGYVPPELK